MIVVADAQTIYSVYKSDACTKEKNNIYKYLHKKTELSLLKTQVKDIQLIKIPPPFCDKLIMV